MRTFLLLISLFFFSSLMAQQQQLQNLYFFDLIFANAAYTGHHDALSASSTYRKQWTGFKGAPETVQLAVHSPLRNQNMGIGIQAAHDRIGPRATTAISLLYAYRLRLVGGNKLSFGIRATAENHRYNWDEISYRDETDVVKDKGSTSLWSPAFDFAVMFSGDRYFAGIEVNNLSQSKIHELAESEARQYLHARLTGGYLLPVSDNFKLKPNVMARYTPNAPLQLDLNLNVLIIERFWLGAGYRFNYGMLAMLQFQVTRQLDLGYAYDFAANKLRSHHAGSHEVFLSYRFNVHKANFSSPRYF